MAELIFQERKLILQYAIVSRVFLYYADVEALTQASIRTENDLVATVLRGVSETRFSISRDTYLVI